MSDEFWLFFFFYSKSCFCFIQNIHNNSISRFVSTYQAPQPLSVSDHSIWHWLASPLIVSLQTITSLLSFLCWWLRARLTSAIIQSCSACILTDCWTCSFVVIICCITTQASLKKHIPSGAGSHKESKGHSKGPQLIDPPRPAWALPRPAQAPRTALSQLSLTACRGENL